MQEGTRLCTRMAVEWGEREGRRRLILRRWKYADRVMLLIWDWKDNVLSRMTPRLLTWGEGETEEWSMVREKLSAFERVDLVPIRSSSVLSLLSLRKLEGNQDLSSVKQSVREEGGRVELGLLER